MAVKKAKIALTVGGILGILYFAYVVYSMINSGFTRQDGSWDAFVQAIIMIPCFMLYAFGYAFGWKRCKGFVANVAKVSADLAFIAIVVQLITGKGLGRGLMIAMGIFGFSIGIVWIPGVVWGIKQVLEERRTQAA